MNRIDLLSFKGWVLGLGVMAILGTFALLFRRGLAEDQEIEPGDSKVVSVDSVRSGSMAKLDSDQKLVYAGIVSPRTDRPLCDEAKRRNAELVEGKKLRLRFDNNRQDTKGRLLAYAFTDGLFVNEALVREGLAYVRLTSDTRRYEKRLLAAQAEARKKKRGLWRMSAGPREAQYPADPKYGHFHRGGCEEVPKIKPERLVVCRRRRDALDQGFAPCQQCSP